MNRKELHKAVATKLIYADVDARKNPEPYGHTRLYRGFDDVLRAADYKDLLHANTCLDQNEWDQSELLMDPNLWGQDLDRTIYSRR